MFNICGKVARKANRNLGDDYTGVARWTTLVLANQQCSLPVFTYCNGGGLIFMARANLALELLELNKCM